MKVAFVSHVYILNIGGVEIMYLVQPGLNEPNFR